MDGHEDLRLCSGACSSLVPGRGRAHTCSEKRFRRPAGGVRGGQRPDQEDPWTRVPHPTPVHDRPERAARARVVVTGGAGFLGSHLCTALRGAGRRGAWPSTTSSPGRRPTSPTSCTSPAFRLVRCDVTDFVHVPGRVDLVLHFASPASPVDYLRMPVETLKVGSRGHVARPRPGQGEGRPLRARLDLGGVRRPAGAPPAGDVLGPRQPDRPAGGLRRGQAVRRGADDGLPRARGRRHRASCGSSTPTARGCARTTAGPSRPSSARRCSASPLTVAGDGSQTRSVCFVDDLVRGILAFAATGHPGPVNLGNPEELTVLRIAEDVAAGRRVGLARSSTSALPVDDPKVRRPDTALARAAARVAARACRGAEGWPARWSGSVSRAGLEGDDGRRRRRRAPRRAGLAASAGYRVAREHRGVTRGVDDLAPRRSRASRGSRRAPCGSPGRRPSAGSAGHSTRCRWGSTRGPHRAGDTGPKRVTEGVPKAVARCATPVSPLSTSAAVPTRRPRPARSWRPQASSTPRRRPPPRARARPPRRCR